MDRESFIEILDENSFLRFDNKVDKWDVLELMAERACKLDAVIEPDVFREAVFGREKIMSTGIGRGIAIPHGITDAVSEIFILTGIIPSGVDYNAVDSLPVRLVFMVGSPVIDGRFYLKVLAGISKIFREAGALDEFLSLETEDRMREFLREKWLDGYKAS